MRWLIVLALIAASVTAARAAPQPRVVILQSSAVAAYQRPAQAFRDTLVLTVPGVRIETHVLDDDRAAAERLVDGLLDRDVALVFAVGARAAHVAASAQHEVPVVFTSVLDWRSYRGALGRGHVAGVALEVPADAQLTQMKLLVPGLRRVVVVTRSERHQPPALVELRQAGQVLGIAIEVVPIHRLDRLARFGGAAVDTAVYPLADPAVYTPEGFLALVAAARRHRLPLVAFSREFVEVGAAMAVEVNDADLGSQAATMAAEILDGEARPDQLGVAAPVGTALVVNQAAAAAVGLPLSASLARLADDVYASIAELSDDDFAAAPLVAGAEDTRGERDPWATDGSELAFFRVKEEIVSVASRWAQQRSKAPSIVSVLTHDDLRALGVTNLAEALQLVPGFTHRYTNLGDYDLLFRGQKAPADLLVLLDGVRLNSLYDGAVSYDLPIDDIRRIEVIRGPGSALYGTNAFAGVISVLTFDARAGDTAVVGGTWFPSGSAFHDTNTFASSGYLRQTTRWRGWDLGVAALFEASQGARMRMPYDLNGPFAADDPRYLNDAHRRFALTATLRGDAVVRAGDRLQLQPKLFVHDRGPNFGPAETLATNAQLRQVTVHVPLDYTVPLGRRLELTTRLSYGLLAVDDDLQVRPDDFTSRANPIPAPDGLRRRTAYHTHTVTLEPQLRWQLPRTRPLWTRGTLTLGALAEYGAISAFSYDQNYVEYLGSLISDANFSDAVKQQLSDQGIPTRGYQNYDDLALDQREADRFQLSTYGEAQLQLPGNPIAETWLTGGVRFDAFSDYRAPDDAGRAADRKRYLTANPRGAIVAAPTLGGGLAGVTLKLIHGWAFRAPTFAELYDSTTKVTDSTFRIPNENLEPQTTKVTELGVELRPISTIGNWLGPARRRQLEPYGGALALRMNLFEMRTADILAADPLFNPAGYQIINLNGHRVTGIEAELDLRLTAHDFVFANASRVDPRQLGTCIREASDGSCPAEYVVTTDDIRAVPERRLNLGMSLRPFGLAGELLGDRDRGWYRRLRMVRMTLTFHGVSDSANDARTVFEQLRFAFRHPGYRYADVGVSHQATFGGRPLAVRAFIHNVTDADVAEPLILQLEPRPAYGYFLPRPGRRFSVSAEWKY